jgi:hypothetical protein
MIDTKGEDKVGPTKTRVMRRSHEVASVRSREETRVFFILYTTPSVYKLGRKARLAARLPAYGGCKIAEYDCIDTWIGDYNEPLGLFI